MCTQVPVLIEVESQRSAGRVKVEATEPPRGEVLRLVNLNERAGRFVQEVARQRREPLRSLLVNKPTQGVKDAVQHRDGFSSLCG